MTSHVESYVLEAIYQKKYRWSTVRRFPGKGGGSLGSLKYQAFPSQILFHNTFTNPSLSNSLRAQSNMKTKFYASKQCKATKHTRKLLSRKL